MSEPLLEILLPLQHASTHPREVHQGDVVRVRCDDGVTRVGYWALDKAGEAFLIPLGTTIPLVKPRPARKQVAP